MKSDELFKIVEDHPSYMISNHGRVLNTNRNRFLKGWVDEKGYQRVELNGVCRPIHILVCEAFHENPEGCDTVNHIDEDKQNNHATNVEWMWNADNVKYSHAKTYTMCSPSGDAVTFHNLSEFCRTNNLSQPNMSAVIKGRRKSHKGWKLCL